MSLRTRLRISIVALAAIVVIALSSLYVYDFTRISFEDAQSRAKLLASGVRGYVLEHVNEDMNARNEHASTLDEFKNYSTEILRTDPRILINLRRTRASASDVLDVQITDAHGTIVAGCNEAIIGHPATFAHDFESLHSRNAFRNLWDLFNRSEDYATSLPVTILGQTQLTPPVFFVRVIIQSLLLRRALAPSFLKIGAGFMISLAVAMFLAALVPNLVLTPLERVSRSIERISAGEPLEVTAAPGEVREFADVQSKLSILGQQYRGAKQDALALRTNIEQLLRQLEEAVLLFDADGRLLIAGQSVEPLVGKPRNELVGEKVEDVFPPSTRFGETILEGIRSRRPWKDHVIEFSRDGGEVMRLSVNIDPLEKASGGNAGTLVTLRDADTRHQLEAHLDLSSRLAALSRLTSGVAHEIKNPLNAIALHLEVLKTKLDESEPEIDVIAGEIKRLDHVVKTFLSFNKPIELHMRLLDLSWVAREVVNLVSPDAQSKGIAVDTRFAESAWISGDADLVKQAILNIVVNAIEAMAHGGHLTVRTEIADGESDVVIVDSGPGIPAEVQDKIFNLYFSTKQNGSGIGLAMAFRVVQLHSGTIDFASEPGKGTSFRLRFPRLTGQQDEGLSRAAGSGRRI